MKNDVGQPPVTPSPAIERRQRLRLRRFYMALASYLMWYTIAVGGAEVGLVRASRTTIIATGIGILLTQTVFFVLFRSGVNRRFKDPSLTLPQILVGLAWGLLLIAVAREIRGLILMVYMVILLFGIFALDQRQFVIAALAGYLGYLGLIIAETYLDPGAFSHAYYLTSALITGGMLVWTTLFGAYVSNLRYKLLARNEELEQALDRIRELANRDELTGLYNRRVVMQAIQQEITRSERTGRPFSVCIMDLDHFKKVNDRFGHAGGDRVLKEFAEFMQSELRGMDLAAASERGDAAFARYGGEEFIIVMPDTDLQGAFAAAERLRIRQDMAHTNNPEQPHVTLSAGVAEYVKGEGVESLLRRADQALYDAKFEGRNRVCRAPSRNAGGHDRP